ncbi:hypothetical protein C8R45DRAFT_1069954 [Mycena sanguinolenta]|nr:hypothetical protein C8R45DRAFT_1069954 [Mycena sanguinolenta]
MARKRGAPSKWNAEQQEFLLDQYHVFESAQRTNKLPDFWPKMEREFFKRWPEQDVLGIIVTEDDGSAEDPTTMSREDAKRLGEAEKSRKKQLASWFNNQGQKIKRQRDTVAPSKSGSLAAKLFKQLSKKRRRLQEVEIFQKRNKRLIDDAVQAKLKKAKKNGDDSSDDDDSSSDDNDDSSSSEHSSTSSDDDNNDHSDSDNEGATSKPKMDIKRRAKVMRVRRKIVQKLWKNATAAEKATVREIYTQQQAHVVEDIFDKPIGERTPEEIQSALDELPGIVAEFHAGIFAMTGWLGVTLLGGPTPEEGGAVTQKTGDVPSATLSDSDSARITYLLATQCRKTRATPVGSAAEWADDRYVKYSLNTEPLATSIPPSTSAGIIHQKLTSDFRYVRLDGEPCRREMVVNLRCIIYGVGRSYGTRAQTNGAPHSRRACIVLLFERACLRPATAHAWSLVHADMLALISEASRSGSSSLDSSKARTKTFSKKYCSGTSPGGLTLAESIQDWDNVIRGVGQSLKRCNPREMRKLRALNPGATASESSVPAISNSEPSTGISTLPATKMGKNGLPLKPTKTSRKESRAAKRVAAKAATAASASASVSAGPEHDNSESMLDNLLPFDSDTQEPIENGGAGMAPLWLNDDDIPIDPVLRSAATPAVLDATLLADPPAATAHTPFDSDNPIIEAFGALAPTPARPSYQSLELSLQGFVYPPPSTTPRTTPPVASSPVPPFSKTPRTTPPAPTCASPTAPSASAMSRSMPMVSLPLTSPRTMPPVLPALTTPRSTPLVPSAPASVPLARPAWTTPRTTPPAPSRSPVTPPVSMTPHTTPLLPPAPPGSTMPRTTPPAPTGTPVAPPTLTPHRTTPPRPPVAPPASTPPHRTPLVPPAPTGTPPTPPRSTTLHTTLPALTAPRTTLPASTRPSGAHPASTTPHPTPAMLACCRRRPSPSRGHSAMPPRTTTASRARGRGSRGGHRGRGGGSGRSVTARDAGFTFLQTYDAEGQPIPLSLDTPLPGPLPREVEQVRSRERARDKAAEAARADAEWRKSLVHNPAGGADLVVLLPLKPRRKNGEDTSLELPEGSKRVRKPAVSREMPVPLSARPVPGVADARQVQLDQELLERLQNGKGTKKRKHKDDSENSKVDVENTAPVTKKDFVNEVVIWDTIKNVIEVSTSTEAFIANGEGAGERTPQQQGTDSVFKGMELHNGPDFSRNLSRHQYLGEVKKGFVTH